MKDKERDSREVRREGEGVREVRQVRPCVLVLVSNFGTIPNVQTTKIIGIFGHFQKNGQKHPINTLKRFKTKKLFFSAPERARTVLNAFLECMYLVAKIFAQRSALARGAP